MKKILFPIISFLLLLASCSKDKETDPLRGYLQAYQSLSMYMDVAMDPFHVAYRLHLYREGGETETLREKLFPQATVERAENGQTYTLTYAESTSLPNHDYYRLGDVIIHTYGAKLSEGNAVWKMETNKEKPYFVYHPSYGYWIFELDPEGNEYSIANNGSNSWNIRGDQFYMLNYYNQANSTWDLDIVVTRTDGSGSDLTNARFKMESGSHGHSGGTLGVDVRYRYEILSPVIYSGACDYNTKSAGEDRFVRMDAYGYTGLDSIQVNYGQTVVCNPNFSLSVRAEGDSGWQTNNYTFQGDWIN